MKESDKPYTIEDRIELRRYYNQFKFILMKQTTFLFIGLLLISLSGCLHKSGLKKEKGIAIEKQYQPEFNGSGTSFNTNGTLGVHTLHEDAKYMVVFKCEHGIVFAINNSNVYGKVSKGDSVTISYKELLNDKNEVKDFDFIDANKD